MKFGEMNTQQWEHRLYLGVPLTVTVVALNQNLCRNWLSHESRRHLVLFRLTIHIGWLTIMVTPKANTLTTGTVLESDLQKRRCCLIPEEKPRNLSYLANRRIQPKTSKAVRILQLFFCKGTQRRKIILSKLYQWGAKNEYRSQVDWGR